jgi:HlyD family secretion protein
MKHLLNRHTIRQFIFSGFLFILLMVGLSACDRSSSTYQGYVEGKYAYLSSPVGGKLQIIGVHQGDTIKKGQLIFVLDQQPEFSTVQEAISNVNAAAYDLADLKLGERPSELAAIEAQIAQAKANLNFSQQTLKRYQALYKQHFVDKQTLDQYIAQSKADQAVVDNLAQNLKTAKLSSRVNQVRSASAKMDAAAAELQSARWNLAQKTVYAPANGIIHDTFYRIGEEIPAYQAVASLLIPKESYVVFYVSETILSQVKLNAKVNVTMDGDKKTYPATISFVSDAAEYTPPVIYSRETRSKLVYRIEAKFTSSNALPIKPGQPVDVTLT